MAPKIAMIRAGSIGVTRKLVQDILTVPELADAHFAFTVISKDNMDRIRQLAERDVLANRKPARIWWRRQSGCPCTAAQFPPRKSASQILSRQATGGVRRAARQRTDHGG